MQDTAGGWLDERLDAEPRWAPAASGAPSPADLEAEAAALLDRSGRSDVDDTVAVTDRDDSWLAASDLGVGADVGADEEIVIAATEVDAVESDVARAASLDDAALDPVFDAPSTPSTPDQGESGIVDPFEVFLASTESGDAVEDDAVEDDAVEDVVDPPDPDGETAPGGPPREDGSIDDIAPLDDVRGTDVHPEGAGGSDDDDAGAASQRPEAERADDTDVSTAQGSRLDAFDALDPDEGFGSTSRLDAFDAVDPAEVVDSTTPGPADADRDPDGGSHDDPTDDVGGDVG